VGDEKSERRRKVRKEKVESRRESRREEMN